MIFLSLLINLLLVTVALAAPSKDVPIESRVARRRGQPLRRVDKQVAASNISHVQYSSNWAGAVWDTYPSGTFKAVTGTFVVPTPSAPDGSASAWVGIDGDTCGNAILQTGVDFNYNGGSISFDAWYEWYPDYAYNFNGISISAGDTIKLTVTASSTTSGTAVIENVSTGKTVKKSLSSSYALCEENAEWIVEDYTEGSGLVPLCDFGTVGFTNAYATTKSGSKVSPNGATVIDMQQNGKVLTSVTKSSSGVAIKYS